MYREHGFVERCYCEAEASRGCDCCGRARCDAHLTRALCHRCDQALARELAARTGAAWVSGGVSSTVAIVTLLGVGMGGIALVAAPVGLLVGFFHRRLQRRSLVTALGPAMSASKGELAAPTREASFPEAPPARDVY